MQFHSNVRSEDYFMIFFFLKSVPDLVMHFMCIDLEYNHLCKYTYRYFYEKVFNVLNKIFRRSTFGIYDLMPHWSFQQYLVAIV